VLDAVEVAANLFGGVNTVVEVGDETGNGPLEVNVVLPEGIVGIDEQRLVDGATRRLAWRLIQGGHELIIRRFGTAITKVASRMPRLGDVWPG
jgi:hypothetical protein